MSDTPRVGIEVAVDGSGVEAGLARVDAAVNRTGRNLDTLGTRGSAALDTVGAEGSTAAGRVDAATRSMVNSIQRTTAALDAGSRSSREYYEALARQRGINTDALRPYLQQLEEVTQRQAAARAGLDATSGSLGNMGQSAAQTQAALRGVPAQITDIITSLQGGQAPLTVFLQQGGQLRDMFGSAGAAARALGSTVLKMVNPFTVAAAAALALAVAYNEGSKEADAYNRALILTGNAAATTAGELADMARAISASVGTQGDAAAALAALAGTGDVSSANLQRFGEVAVRAQKSIGISVDETAQAFADLAKSPLAASEKLNEQYRYLTVAVYEQIRALEQQGRTEEAAEVAQNAYADAIDERAKAIKANLGSIESAWASVTGVAKKAWDSMLNIGREETLNEKLADVASKIAAQQQKLYSFIDAPEAKKQIERLRIEQSLLQDQVREQTRANEAKAAANQLQQAGIEWSKLHGQYLDKETQKRNELTAATNKAAAANIDLNSAEFKAVVAGINEKYADKSKANAAAVKAEANAYASLITAIEERIAQTAREAAGLKPMTDSQKLQVALEESLASGKLKLTAAHKAEYEAKIRGLAANESVIQSQKRAAQGQAEIEKLYKSLADERAREITAATQEADRNEQVAATYGLTKVQIAELTLARLEDQLAQRSSLGLTLEEIEHLEKLIDLKKRSVEALKEVDGREVAAKSAKEAEEAWKRTAATIEESLTDALMRGFESGKSFAENLRDATINMFKTMILRPTIQAVLQPMSSSLTSAFQASGAGGSSFGGAMDLVSVGKTIYSGFSGGMAASMGSYITQMGNLFGSSAMSAFGTGMGLTGSQAATAAAAYGGTGTATGGALSAGSSFASAVPIIGWIIAGMMANNKFFKQGWNIDGQTTDITKSLLGSTLKGNPFGLLGGAMTFGIGQANTLLKKIGLSDQMASLLSGSSLWTRAFGHQKPSIESEGATLGFDANGAYGQEYAKVLQKGGWFRSDKRSTVTAGISNDFDKALTDSFVGMRTATAELGKVLGVTGVDMLGFSKTIDIVWDKDKTKREQQVTELLAGLGNDLATYLVPNIATFAQSGETAAVTLQRLAAEVLATDAVLNALGVTAQQAFGAVGLASISARERLIALAGGVEALAAQVDFYTANFLTEAERMAPVQKQVIEQMAALGYAGVTTVEQFKAVMSGLTTSGALATESGAKAYAGLLAIAPQFKVVADYMQQIAEAKAAEEAQATADALDKAAAALQALKDNAAMLLSAVDTAMDALQRSVDAQRKTVQVAYEDSMRAIEAGITTAGDAVQRLGSLSTTLRNTLNGMSAPGQEAGTRAAAQAQIREMLAIAKSSGVLPDAESLGVALGRVTASRPDDFASFLDYARDYARTAGDIAELSGLTDSQLTTAQLQLRALEGQRDDLQKSYDEEMARLDGIIEHAQSQIDILNGINQGVLAIPAALQALVTAIGAAGSNSIIRDQSDTAQIAGLYNELLGRNAEAAGMAFWMDKAAAGWSMADIRAGIIDSDEYRGRVPGFANGGAHAGGWRIVGERGPELEYTGPSRIYSNDASRDMFGGLEQRIESLEKVLATGFSRLIAETKRGADATENVEANTRDEEVIA